MIITTDPKGEFYLLGYNACIPYKAIDVSVHAAFFACLYLNPGNRCDMLLSKVCSISTDYTTLGARR
jgi:hypothetical protein